LRAAVYFGPGDIRVVERADPAPRADNLVLDVIACAICGTDLKLATIGNPKFQPDTVIGHELVGRISHAGDQVKGFSVGERVTLATTISCGECPYCNLNLGNMCLNAKPISSVYDGAFAEKMAVPPLALARGCVIKVPDNAPDHAAALGEPLSCAINAQQIAGVKDGDKVVILGGGPLGAIHAEVAKANGAQTVMVVDLDKNRLALLKRLSDIIVIDGGKEDVRAVIDRHTGNLGADVVMMCAPARAAHEQAPTLLRKGGAVSFFASLPKGDSEITLDSRLIHYNELRIVASSDSRPEHVQQAVDFLAAGKIDADAIVTHRVSLVDFHQGIQLMKDKQSLKVLVQP